MFRREFIGAAASTVLAPKVTAPTDDTEILIEKLVAALEKARGGNWIAKTDDHNDFVLLHKVVSTVRSG